MNLKNIKRKNKNSKKTILLTIRVTPALSDWLKKNEYSPTGIFYEAIKELGYEDHDG